MGIYDVLFDGDRTGYYLENRVPFDQGVGT